MISKIERHPTITHQNDIYEICKPLQHFNISYFCHVNIDRHAKFSAIANNPNFHGHYLNNQYYNVDLHMAKKGLISNYFLWDFANHDGKSLEADQEAAAFGVKHTFTILDKTNYEDNYYHFATHISDKSINQTYLANIDMLKLFILHFKNSIASSRALSTAYQITFDLNYELGEFSLKNNSSKSEYDRKLFCENLNVHIPDYSINGKSLSEQQVKILYWLHQGKTIYDIAKIMQLAEVTVNKHIANIKNTMGCYTQFQLGEIFSKITSVDLESLIKQQCMK